MIFEIGYKPPVYSKPVFLALEYTGAYDAFFKRRD
jgi:hypothetical protein